jgi:DNA-binding SARP family transcriptional activator
LQRLVSRLRKTLPDGLVEGRVDGYWLRVEPDAVDAVRFEWLVGQARQDDEPRRIGLLREALALWRGAAMQDVGLEDSAAFDAAVTRLEGLRLTAMEDRYDAEISLGHGASLVTELTDVVTAHPMRERLVAALMRALVATGRDTEALLVYQRTRQALADALGVDPSAELSELHVALLRGELVRQAEDRKTNLRAELTSFVGQDADITAVRELITGHRLTTVIGPGGAGKTRLATETARTLSNLARVCRALDGVPLAIELAAARLRTMSLDQLAGRLDDRFRLLTGGSRTAPLHHRTLRAVVDWSWELLTEPERMVLRTLAVFSGGASLDAAEQVCAAASAEQEELLQVLTALTEKSLLLTDPDGAPHYRMLDTITEYARDRLAEAGESDLARHAHLAYFTRLAEAADPHLRRAEQMGWLATLDAGHDNIAMALRGALAAGEAHGAMRLAAAAGWYWWLAGHKAEGIELITAAASIPGVDPPGLPIHPAQRRRQPAAGPGRPAGTHVAGAA